MEIMTTSLIPKRTASDFWFEGGFKGYNCSPYSAQILANPQWFDEAAAQNVDGMRLFIRATLDANGQYEITAQHYNYHKWFIEQCERVGLDVIPVMSINPEGWKSNYWFSDAVKFRIAELFKMLCAQLWGAHSNVIAVELLNEPVPTTGGTQATAIAGVPGDEKWKTYAIVWIEAIRSILPDMHIVVEPAPWGTPTALINSTPLPYPKLIYSLHYYNPHNLTHQGIDGAPHGLTYPGHYSADAGKYYQKQQINYEMRLVKDWSLANNIPIFVGEFSCVYYTDLASRTAWIADVLAAMEGNQFCWSYHAWHEWNGWDLSIENLGGVERAIVGDPLTKLLESYLN